MNKPNRFLWFASVAFVLIALVELTWLHALQPLENRLSDWFVRIHAAKLAPDPEIVIVDVDDASLVNMQDVSGNWPWSRAVHGDMVTGILAQSPKAIVFDLQFTLADKYRPEGDQVFNEALRENRKQVPIYFPMVRVNQDQDWRAQTAEQTAKLYGLIRSPQSRADARIAIMPPDAIDQRFWRLGLINFLPDSDGVGRRYHLYPSEFGWRIPSLPARVASDLGYRVPDQADMILAWRGLNRAFKHVSYFDLYQGFNREKRARPNNELTGKIVIIGAAATGLHDKRVTPISTEYSGVEILATAIDNLKNQRMMSAAPLWLPALLGLALLLGMSAMFMTGTHAFKAGGFLLAFTALALTVSYALVARLYLLPVLSALAIAWAHYFVCALHLYLRERKSHQHAVQMFSRFVNPHIVKEMIARGGLSRVGESREISILFSDIRGFTTLSETRTPQEIVELLNRYFALQVAVVFKHGGSLDKFIGDCIMAFWGAPLDDPDHALHAVEAALEMADVLQEFKRELGEDKADFDVGIGVHSGPAVVGLIGPEQKLEYTAIGDTVNLASRIESLTKGVSRILVSGETRTLCGDSLDFAPFGSYKVKGREQEVELFAPNRRGTK